MAGWKLEVYRMAGYVALPIFCFYLFNKPEYFKEFLAKNRQYYFEGEDKNSVSLLDEFKKQKEQDNQNKLIAQIEALKSKK